MFTVPLVVAPKTRGISATWLYLLAQEAPFHGVIVYDGILKSNVDGKRKISDLLSESERTIEVDGVLKVTSATQVFNDTREVALEQTTCNDFSGTKTFERNVTGDTSTISTSLNTLLSGNDEAVMAIHALHPKMRQLNQDDSVRIFTNSNDATMLGIPGDYCNISSCKDGKRIICVADSEGWCSQCADITCNQPKD
jgi:hypothetical protein